MKYSFLFFLSLIFLISCGDDDPVECDINDVNSTIAQEVDDLNAAAMVWANDPTSDNCNAWKDAAQDYLDTVEDFGDTCNNLSQSDFDAALAGAREALNSISCN